MLKGCRAGKTTLPEESSPPPRADLRPTVKTYHFAGISPPESSRKGHGEKTFPRDENPDCRIIISRSWLLLSVSLKGLPLRIRPEEEKPGESLTGPFPLSEPSPAEGAFGLTDSADTPAHISSTFFFRSRVDQIVGRKKNGVSDRASRQACPK